MQSFSRAEIMWMSEEMKSLSEQREYMSQMAAATNMERAFFFLRAEQFASIADRLAKAIENDDHRIEIRRN